MRRGSLLLVALLAIGAAIFVRSLPRGENPAIPQAHTTSEVTPVCPWREPLRDLTAFFPGATGFKTETRILSGMMAPIHKALGRMMTMDENPLRIFRVQRESNTIGSVLVCRVKGESGGIELVIAVETNGTVRAVAMQSQREPEPVARSITSRTWLASFVGKTHQSALRMGEDLPGVPVEARISAQAIAEGVRSQLIVFSFAGQSAEVQPTGHPNHHY